MSERIRIKDVTVLSDDWYLLKKTTFDFRSFERALANPRQRNL